LALADGEPLPAVSDSESASSRDRTPKLQPQRNSTFFM
jgi:hypothetical protein